jgi:hypothetical protein
MQWLLTTHVRRYHTYHESSGHIWQGRFKAFPTEQDEHLLTVLRYVERNPVRAGLVMRAEEWRRSSAGYWGEPSRGPRVETGPVARPEPWLSWVNDDVADSHIEQIRMSVNRGTPYCTASRLNSGVKRLREPIGHPLGDPVPIQRCLSNPGHLNLTPFLLPLSSHCVDDWSIERNPGDAGV